MAINYSRINWKDSPDTDTPINAENLNKMDKGIADCASELATKQESTDNNLQTNSKQIIGAINEINSDLTDLKEEVQKMGIPALNYAQPLHTFTNSSSLSYTASKDCYIVGSLLDSTQSWLTLKINDRLVARSINGRNAGFVYIKAQSGDIIALNKTDEVMAVYEPI